MSQINSLIRSHVGRELQERGYSLEGLDDDSFLDGINDIFNQFSPIYQRGEGMLSADSPSDVVGVHQSNEIGPTEGYELGDFSSSNDSYYFDADGELIIRDGTAFYSGFPSQAVQRGSVSFPPAFPILFPVGGQLDSSIFYNGYRSLLQSIEDEYSIMNSGDRYYHIYMSHNGQSQVYLLMESDMTDSMRENYPVVINVPLSSGAVTMRVDPSVFPTGTLRPIIDRNAQETGQFFYAENGFPYTYSSEYCPVYLSDTEIQYVHHGDRPDFLEPIIRDNGETIGYIDPTSSIPDTFTAIRNSLLFTRLTATSQSMLESLYQENGDLRLTDEGFALDQTQHPLQSRINTYQGANVGGFWQIPIVSRATGEETGVSVSLPGDLMASTLLYNPDELPEQYFAQIGPAYVPFIRDLSEDRIHVIASVPEDQEIGLDYVPIMRPSGSGTQLSYYLNRQELNDDFFYHRNLQAWFWKEHVPNGMIPVVNAPQRDGSLRQELLELSSEQHERALIVLDQGSRPTTQRFLTGVTNLEESDYLPVFSVSGTGDLIQEGSCYHASRFDSDQVVPVLNSNRQVTAFMQRSVDSDQLPSDMTMILDTEGQLVGIQQSTHISQWRTDGSIETREEPIIGSLPYYNNSEWVYVQPGLTPDGALKVVNFSGPRHYSGDVWIAQGSLPSERLRPIVEQEGDSRRPLERYFLLPENRFPIDISQEYLPLLTDLSEPEDYLNSQFVSTETPPVGLIPVLGQDGQRVAMMDRRLIFKSILVFRTLFEGTLLVRQYQKEQKTNRKHKAEKKEKETEEKRLEAIQEAKARSEHARQEAIRKSSQKNTQKKEQK